MRIVPCNLLRAKLLSRQFVAWVTGFHSVSGTGYQFQVQGQIDVAEVKRLQSERCNSEAKIKSGTYYE